MDLKLRNRAAGFYFGAHVTFIGCKVPGEKGGELLRRRLVGGFVGPSIVRNKNLARDVRTFGHHIQPEHGVALGLRLREGAAVDGIDDCEGGRLRWTSSTMSSCSFRLKEFMFAVD
jgi:hypothetical protein